MTSLESKKAAAKRLIELDKMRNGKDGKQINRAFFMELDTLLHVNGAQLAEDFIAAIEWIEGADCTCDAETGSEESYKKCECFRCDFLEKLGAG